MSRQTEIHRHVDIVGGIFWTFGVIAFCLGLQVASAACICLGIAILLCNT
jgi:hypothetical protein